MTPGNINRLYQKLAKNLSEAKSELVFKNHYELLISVILSAQSTDKTVNKVTPALFSSCPTPAEMLALGQSKLAKIIKPIGLAPAKSKNIINTCKILLEKHNGRVPDNRKDLENLPGVGRKTANVVLNEGFGKPTIAVDTHVFRVANRTGMVKANNPNLTQLLLEKLVPKKWLLNAHHLMILHGRYICKSQKPLCHKCSIFDLCHYKEKKFFYKNEK